MRVCLNLNENGPLKVSAEDAGTLSSPANGALIKMPLCLMHTGTHTITSWTHPQKETEKKRQQIKNTYST